MMKTLAPHLCIPRTSQPMKTLSVMFWTDEYAFCGSGL